MKFEVKGRKRESPEKSEKSEPFLAMCSECDRISVTNLKAAIPI